MAKVDTKKLKAALTLKDYEKILKEIGIPIFTKSDTQWVLWTGEKHKDPYQGSPKLYFYLDTKIFISYTSSCSMDIIGLVQKRLNVLGENASFIEAINKIVEITGIDSALVQRINQTKYKYNWEDELGKYIRFRKQGYSLNTYDPNILNIMEKMYPQEWADEGISEDSLEKYNIGYYERLHQTTIPCYDDMGELIGIRVRNWQPELLEGAKYIPLTTLDGTCYKFNTNNVFYGINYNKPEIEQTKAVFIGESEKFVLKMDSWYHEKCCALGMFGSNLGLHRRNQLLKMGVNRVIFVPDNDWIGPDARITFEDWCYKIQDNYVSLFKGFAQVEIVYDCFDLLGPKQNAADKDYDTWIKLYENRQIYN